MSIHHLPEEVFVLIVDRLPPDDRARMSGVCTVFHKHGYDGTSVLMKENVLQFLPAVAWGYWEQYRKYRTGRCLVDPVVNCRWFMLCHRRKDTVDDGFMCLGMDAFVHVFPYFVTLDPRRDDSAVCRELQGVLPWLYA